MPGIDPNRPPLQPRAEATMSAERYKAMIKKLGLSQVRAARFFGLSDRQGQRIASGAIELPPAVEYLIRLMIKHDVMPGDLNKEFK